MALTNTYRSPPDKQVIGGPSDDNDFVGQVFLKCNARRVLERCGRLAQEVVGQGHKPKAALPEIELDGDLEATFPYILSHIEYIIGELLRNSVQAVVETHRGSSHLPAIRVLVCEAPQHVIFRISDQGGGIPRDVLPYIWSFSKGPRHQSRLQNLNKVPQMAATMQELSAVDAPFQELQSQSNSSRSRTSLSPLTSRRPNLRLGMGLPMSRVYAEYWAGSLDIHSLEGYGTDAFLHISKLGNKNEQLSIRASMDKL